MTLAKYTSSIKWLSSINVYKICKRRKLHEIFEINSCKKMYHTLSKSSDNRFCSIKTLFLNHLHFMWSREDILKKNKANWDTWDISPKADFVFVNLTSQRFICNPLNLKRIPCKIKIILKNPFLDNFLCQPEVTPNQRKQLTHIHIHRFLIPQCLVFQVHEISFWQGFLSRGRKRTNGN